MRVPISAVFGCITAQRDLVVFNARTIETKDADVAHVVVTTCVDAARDFDLQMTDVMLQLQFVKARCDGFLRTGIERAVASAQ